MSGHTRAPWQIVGDPELSGYWEIEATPPAERVVCIVMSTEANARLIAAAPELLEALKVMVDNFWGRQPAEKERASFRRDYPSHSIVAAEAAIAKVEGRS